MTINSDAELRRCEDEVDSNFKFPDAQCMAYLPTFG